MNGRRSADSALFSSPSIRGTQLSALCCNRSRLTVQRSMLPQHLVPINRHCPLLINWAAWEDPTLVVRGDTWSFTTLSPWRLISEHRLVAGCEDANAGDVVHALRSQRIERAEPLTDGGLPDLRLILSGGQALEVFVAGHYEPWVFRVPELTIVPSPSDPDWFERPPHP